MLNKQQIEQIAKKLQNREQQSRARTEATISQINKSKDGLTNYIKTCEAQQFEAQKELVDIEKLEQVFTNKYAEKVRQRVDSLMKLQSLIEGEIDENVIKQVNLIKQVNNEEIDASALLETQGVNIMKGN